MECKNTDLTISSVNTDLSELKHFEFCSIAGTVWVWPGIFVFGDNDFHILPQCVSASTHIYL